MRISYTCEMGKIKPFYTIYISVVMKENEWKKISKFNLTKWHVPTINVEKQNWSFGFKKEG